MGESRPLGVKRRGRRRWNFAGCVFDEANWSLIVDGKRVPVESKPLEILRELLLRAGQVVSKDELLDTIWPDVTVVEASLPTAVRKLRLALNDDRRDMPILETVPRIGYRLAEPVEEEELADAPGASPTALQLANADHIRDGGSAPQTTGQWRTTKRLRFLAITGGLAITSALFAWGLRSTQPAPATATARSFSQRDVRTALRKVDVDSIEAMLAAGWDPNASLDTDRNGALGILVNNCEWDPGNDRRRMLLAARTLIDGGAKYADRNAWGDTPYSIARADRYCGPDHPVTKMFERMCFKGDYSLGNRCLADYRRNSSGAVVRRF